MAAANGKTVLVTGASAGIGRATALALAERGHRVVAAARRVDRLQALAAERPGVVPLEMDVSDPGRVRDAMAQLEQCGVQLDVLVNNAGFAAVGPVEAVPDEEIRRQFDVNVHGLLNVTRAVLPQMRQRRAGRIINISSVVGRTTFPAMGVYGASKHAVEALSDALRAEVRSDGIDVVVVEPGFVRSDINTAETASAASPEALGGAYRRLTSAAVRFVDGEIERGADPAELAALLVRIVEANRPRTRYLVGARSRMLVGAFARTPDRVADTLKLRAMGAGS